MVLAAIWLRIGDSLGVSNSEMLRDPAGVYGLPVLAGAISIMGVLFLVGGASALAFCASLRGCPRRGLLLSAAALSMAIALDDQFLLHERVLPTATGLPEIVFVGSYGVATLALIAAARSSLGARALFGLLPAIAFLGLAALVDTKPFGIRPSYVLEDLLKLAGYVSWMAFWVVTARLQVQSEAPA